MLASPPPDDEFRRAFLLLYDQKAKNDNFLSKNLNSNLLPPLTLSVMCVIIIMLRSFSATF